jgi:hypothetical protein
MNKVIEPKTACVTEEHAATLVDDIFDKIDHSPDSTSVSDLIRRERDRLEQSAKTYFVLGNRARLSFWKVMVELYVGSDYYFKKKGLPDKKRWSFSSYLQETYDIPKSTASSDVQVIKMLIGDRSLLDSPAENLCSKLRVIAAVSKSVIRMKLLAMIGDCGCQEIKDKATELKKNKPLGEVDDSSGTSTDDTKLADEQETVSETTTAGN